MDHQHRAKDALHAVSRLTLSSVEDIIIIIIRVVIQSFERTDAVRCAKQRGRNKVYIIISLLPTECQYSEVGW